MRRRDGVVCIVPGVYTHALSLTLPPSLPARMTLRCVLRYYHPHRTLPPTADGTGQRDI